MLAYRRGRGLRDGQPDRFTLGIYHANVGNMGLRSGGRRASWTRRHLRLAVDILRSIPRTWFLGRALVSLGTLERRCGNADVADGYLSEGFAELSAYGARVDAIVGSEELALVALDQGQAARAATLLAAASRLREQTGATADDAQGAVVRAAVARTRSTLRRAEFAAAWETGRSLDLDEVGRLVAGRPRPAGPAGRRRLTAREHEVAALVAEGLTNRQIAERLLISPATARTHVGHILDKLGLRSRVQIATWQQSLGEVPGSG